MIELITKPKFIYVAYALTDFGKHNTDDCESFTSLTRCKNWVLRQNKPYVISIERADDEIYREVTKWQPKH